MRTVTVLLLVAAIASVLPAAAQTAESPPRYKWIATPCDTWNCALAALALANGDPFVIVLPTRSSAHPWVVLKRVVVGSVEEDPAVTPTFDAECFGELGTASARFSALDPARFPLMLTTTDGGILVVCLHEVQTKKRVVKK